MARYDREEKGKVKFRFVEFELEGNNSALQESLRSISTAITRGGNGTVTVRTNDPKPIATLGSAAKNSNDAEEMVIEDVPQNDGQDNSIEKVRTKRSGVPRSPVILNNFTLDGSKISLKEFSNNKKPENDNQKYLVIAVWAKQEHGIIEVTMDHIHTAYRHMGWLTPADASAPLRNMKKVQYGYFNKGKEKGGYAINHVGENFVLQMPKK